MSKESVFPNFDDQVMSRVAVMADGQWGYVTTSQAKLAGLDSSAISKFGSINLIDQISDDVVRLRFGGRHPNPQLYASWLSLEPTEPAWRRLAPACGVVSHGAAIRMYRVGDIPGPSIEFTVPPGWQNGPSVGAILHEADLAEGDWCEITGMPVTTPVRTLTDLAVGGTLDVVDLAQIARRFVAGAWITSEKLVSKIRSPDREILRQLSAYLDAQRNFFDG